jgi:MFS transporter, Spinster family, sphingosine-1-phosphate transporter
MGSGNKNYLLAILLIILASNGADGWALGIMLEDIKAELLLSDTQLGALSGIAFSLFYAIMGIPIARWADRGNRITIIALTTALWSVMVALCGVAANFAQLLLIRVGVAVGEAGCTPPAHSIISDVFSRAARPRAFAVYMLGAPLSVIIGYFGAGWLNELYGWRATFLMLGIPGLIPAALAWFTLRDPRQANRRESNGAELLSSPTATAPASPQPDLRLVCRTLWHNRTFRHLLLCFSVVYFFGTGISQWQPTFFVRTYGLKTGELGTWFALIYGLGGLLGTIWGGIWASRYAANEERLQLRIMAVAFGCFGLVSAFIYLASNYYFALALMAAGYVVLAMTYGPLFATIQTLVPERMRAMSIAIVYFFANLVGMGLGPLAVGALSDALRPSLGEDSLRYALLVMCPGYFWCAWHLWRGSRSVARDVRAARSDDDAPIARQAIVSGERADGSIA